jgi:hydroxymethylglutaryl-CoA reductase (NADPH)
MDLRNLPSDLDAIGRINARRSLLEHNLGVDLAALAVNSAQLGHAEEKNCEQMFGAVPIPVGLAGPLTVTLSDGTETTVHLPLATTEGALVASVNRGCKAMRGVRVDTQSTYHGVTRSMSFKMSNEKCAVSNWIREHESEWKAVGEATSSHLKILSYEIDEKEDHVFLTIAADTDEAMGMNMVTIAAQAIGEFIATKANVTFVTVAANVDSDKKPSRRTHDNGRGYEATASCTLSNTIIQEVLKVTPSALLATANAKLNLGSNIAGAIGHNCHAANVIAALYLATGQDAAHVVEGSLADTNLAPAGDGIVVRVRLPSLMLGVRGGGTTLPAQSQCRELLLKNGSKLHPCRTLAEVFAAAVLAGEISLLAAQAGHSLASAHKQLGR